MHIVHHSGTIMIHMTRSATMCHIPVSQSFIHLPAEENSARLYYRIKTCIFHFTQTLGYRYTFVHPTNMSRSPDSARLCVTQAAERKIPDVATEQNRANPRQKERANRSYAPSLPFAAQMIRGVRSCSKRKERRISKKIRPGPLI